VNCAVSVSWLEEYIYHCIGTELYPDLVCDTFLAAELFFTFCNEIFSSIRSSWQHPVLRQLTKPLRRWAPLGFPYTVRMRFSLAACSPACGQRSLSLTHERKLPGSAPVMDSTIGRLWYGRAVHGFPNRGFVTASN